MPKTYTTAEAAAKIGVSRQTVFAWIKGGLIEPPIQLTLGKRPVHLWTAENISRARKFKGTLKTGPKPKRKKKP